MKTHMLIQEPATDGTFKYVIYEYDEKYANKMGDAVKQIGSHAKYAVVQEKDVLKLLR